MGYDTDSTKWPTAVEVPQPVKDLVNRFYNLLDDDRPEVGAILADEIFTPDATAYFGGQPSTGSAGMSFDLHNITKRCLAWPFVNLLTSKDIRISRINAWKSIASRKHSVSKVFVCKSDASDLLFIAHVAMGLRNGKEVEGEFCGRLTIAGAQGPNPRLTLYQVWGVCCLPHLGPTGIGKWLTVAQDTSALVKALHS